MASGEFVTVSHLWLLEETNQVAFRNSELITTEKSFMVQTQSQCYNTFIFITYALAKDASFQG